MNRDPENAVYQSSWKGLAFLGGFLGIIGSVIILGTCHENRNHRSHLDPDSSGRVHGTILDYEAPRKPVVEEVPR